MTYLDAAAHLVNTGALAQWQTVTVRNFVLRDDERPFTRAMIARSLRRESPEFHHDLRYALSLESTTPAKKVEIIALLLGT